MLKVSEVFSVGIGLTILGFFLVVILIKILRSHKQKKFKHIFGVPLAQANFKTYQERDVVIPKLKSLADLLGKEIESHRTLLGKISGEQVLWSEGFEVRIVTAREKVELAEEALSQARDVARYFSFDLQTSYEESVLHVEKCNEQ